MAAEIRDAFPDARVELISSGGGRFEVVRDGHPVFEKSKLGHRSVRDKAPLQFLPAALTKPVKRLFDPRSPSPEPRELCRPEHAQRLVARQKHERRHAGVVIPLTTSHAFD